MATSKRATKSRVNFKIHAPDAQQVFVAASFNEWTTLPPGEHEYRFIVAGEWVEDPTVEQREAHPVGSHNSIVTI